MSFRDDFEQKVDGLTADVDRAVLQMENAKKGVLRAQIALARLESRRETAEAQIAVLDGGRIDGMEEALTEFGKILANRKPLPSQGVEREKEDAREAELKERLDLQ